ncbi:LytTR family transcriptional regulator [Sedimentibacter hydroxybenzoicus DSM 7310]|uniref:LytTR family transcriptional regulator n=1 Tax=Sedimentibacter hydroxybenzoicus DSM 7310 TaxID=1123245 RepID=A0A974BKG7_SEDHY|nr:LytTR family DNA-binding domain-containing protein [Sedimentibacter hydroxybenzoicus]NYB74315.1 LytTR family transcriptional regulator [Sedimentibacter hydroxybenzoicus DSM 7310]
MLNRHYKLIVACMDGRTSYVIKGDINKPDSYIAKGTMSVPPTHEEIDYIQRYNRKTMMFLTSGDKEIIPKGIEKVDNEINRKYFVKCCTGVIVNTRNIRKIHRSEEKSRIIELKSGAKVIMTKVYFDNFLKAYSMSVSRLANLKTLED